METSPSNAPRVCPQVDALTLAEAGTIALYGSTIVVGGLDLYNDLFYNDSVINIIDIILQVVFLLLENITFYLFVIWIQNSKKQSLKNSHTILKILAVVCNIIRVTMYRSNINNIVMQYAYLVNYLGTGLVDFINQGGLQFLFRILKR